MRPQRPEYHHITIKGVPLCCSDLAENDTVCGHFSESAAKSAVLRLIENNPEFPVCHYEVVSGYCPSGFSIPEGVLNAY